MELKNKIKKTAAYFGTPLLYCAVGWAVIAAILLPQAAPLFSALSLVSDNAGGEVKAEDGIVSLSDVTSGIIKAADIHFPAYGEKLGNIVMNGNDGEYINASLYFGDGSEQLSGGVGVYMGSSLPGYGSTVLIAGHNHTWFKPLKKAQVGDTVTLTTYYGVYTYKITDIQIKNVSDQSHYDLLADYENLVMYTCYPFGSIGMTPTRYFIYGEYVSGPLVDIRG